MVTILYYVGIVLLSLLSINDFSDKIIRVKRKRSQYNVCKVLFISLNIAIYTGICSAALKLELPQLLLMKDIPADMNDKSLLPVVIAFAYFGLGSASIHMGDKAVSFYGILLGIFQGMFSLRGIDINPIREDIARMQKETKQLTMAVEEFLDRGRERGWVILSDQWKDLNDDNKLLEEHLAGLREASKDLESHDISADRKIIKMKSWFDNRISKISQDIYGKIRNHIMKLVTANDKNQEALENILGKIGLSLPDTVSEENNKIPLCRAAVFSMFAGLILGALSPKFMVPPAGISAGHYMVVWGLGVGVFGLIFSCISYLNARQGYWALLLGGVAGALGHLTIQVMKIALGIVHMPWSDFVEWLPKLSVGTLYGAFLGIMIYLFRYKVQVLLKGKYLRCHIAFAMSSALLFVLLGWVVGVADFTKVNIVAFLAVIGAVVAVMVAMITNAFKDPGNIKSGSWS